MGLQASLLRNKSQKFAVTCNIFEVTTFSTKHIFNEMSCIELWQIGKVILISDHTEL